MSNKTDIAIAKRYQNPVDHVNYIFDISALSKLEREQKYYCKKEIDLTNGNASSWCFGSKLDINTI